ncbi:tyrosine-type recombinase/integrase [Candidatus Aerophobetes bacterium]|nr:tyrosine-type recombinase/integrase [Candidatus Aerophobetes bacterium]
MARLIKVCPDYLKSIVIVALNTGMRKSEILNLKWNNLTSETGSFTLSKVKITR